MPCEVAAPADPSRRRRVHQAQTSRSVVSVVIRRHRAARLVGVPILPGHSGASLVLAARPVEHHLGCRSCLIAPPKAFTCAALALAGGDVRMLHLHSPPTDRALRGYNRLSYSGRRPAFIAEFMLICMCSAVCAETPLTARSATALTVTDRNQLVKRKSYQLEKKLDGAFADVCEADKRCRCRESICMVLALLLGIPRHLLGCNGRGCA
jgi:hypothetical protein